MRARRHRGGGIPTSDQVALAIVRAARIFNVKPTDVFEIGLGHAPARILAAMGLVRAMLASRTAAAAALHTNPNQLAPSMLLKAKVSPAMVQQVAHVLDQAFASRAAEPEPPPRVISSGFGGARGRFEGPLPDAPAPPSVPASAGSRTAGKPKPGGKSPTLIGEPGLLEQVRELRAKHTPWPHISIQLRKPVISLRRAFDPDFVEG